MAINHKAAAGSLHQEARRWAACRVGLPQGAGMQPTAQQRGGKGGAAGMVLGPAAAAVLAPTALGHGSVGRAA